MVNTVTQKHVDTIRDRIEGNVKPKTAVNDTTPILAPYEKNNPIQHARPQTQTSSGGPSSPPGTSRDEDGCAAVKDYGDFDSKGHHSGAYARYCSETDLAGGEEADPKIFPPGWPPLMEDGRSTNPWLPETGQYKYARCHLIANQLGGDGYDPKNLITCLQMPVNSPLMSGMEGQVRTAVESGQQVNYWVKPIYRRNNKSAIPDMMRITAIGRYGDGTPGINMDNCLLNTMKPGNKVLNGAQCRP